MMMHGNDDDLRAGRALDNGVREPTYQAAPMLAMNLTEALGMLANGANGRLNSPRKFTT